MKVKSLITRFDFPEEVRREITLGPGTRLNPVKNRIQLEEVGSSYPLTLDLYVKTRVLNPSTVKKWTGFQVDLTHTKVNGVEVTRLLYRLSDGVTEMYYNGGAGAWVAAAANNWNTEAEVSANIDSFPVASQSLQVVINPSTTDAMFTPLVHSVRILWESDLDELQDYVWESFLPDLKAKIRPIADHAIASTGALTVDLANDFPIETPYDIISVDAVYDLTADPRKLTDLFAAYDSVSKLVTLSAAPPEGNTVLIRFVYAPSIAVNTSQDYIETRKVPEIILESVQQVGKSYQHGRDFVISKTTGAGKRVEVTQEDIEITGRWITDKGRDHARLGTEIRQYFRDNVQLRSVGQDKNYRLWLLDEYEKNTVANSQDTHAGRFRCRIAKAVFYDRDAVDIHGVLNFVPNLSKAT